MHTFKQIAKAATAGAAPLREQDDVVIVAGVEIACRVTLPAGQPQGAVLLLNYKF
ncbi:hypothetical protein [Duganella vulcania]|uniref:hypothetical protein n=1 Tax=Duganella vulcania TaxID=2692166 RepID=UPI0020C3FD78|nr:hypothetical protein [Duganella vulcania]